MELKSIRRRMRARVILEGSNKESEGHNRNHKGERNTFKFIPTGYQNKYI